MPENDYEQGLLDEARAALALALELGADDASVSVSTGRSTRLSHRDGRIEQVKESQGKGLTLELYVDGRYSAHSSNDLSSDVLRGFVRDAVALTRALEPDPHRRLPEPGLYAGRADVPLELVDPCLLTLERDRMLGWLEAMDTAAHADPRVISATASLGVGNGTAAAVTSNGFEGVSNGTSLSMSAEVTLDEGDGRRPESYAYACARHEADLPDPASIGTEALRRAVARLGSTKGDSRRTHLLVDREAVGRLLGRLFGALSAASIQQKRSFLAGRKGTSVGAACLTLRDEPHVPRGLGSKLFDGEGIASKPRVLFENGRLATYLVDTYYGNKLGWEPTSGSLSNVEFELGTHDRDELAQQAGSGVYVTAWNGGNADTTTGDFSFGIRGHTIEGGAIGAPIGEMNVTGNYLELLERLVALGNDPTPYSSFRAPTLLFDDIQVSGT